MINELARTLEETEGHIMTGARSTASVEMFANADVDTTWRIAQPLTPVGFYPKSGPLPAVTEVRDQTGAWDAPGQTRQLMLSDGGSVIEHTRIVDAPSSGTPGFFAYDLSDFRRIFGRIVAGAHAEWRFSAVDGGTSIHWTYTYFALPGRGPVLAVIVRLLWGPYMRRVLPGIVAEVERQK